MAETLDLSALGGERRQVNLPDGNSYDMVNMGDVGPVFMQMFGQLAEEAKDLKDSESTEGAIRLEEVMRTQAQLVIPSMPDTLASTIGFQVATAIVAQFTLDMGRAVKEQTLLPAVQFLVDQIEALDIDNAG